MTHDFIAVGKIRKCFGLKGEVFVEPYSISLDRFKKLVKVFVGFDQNKLVETIVSSVKIKKQAVILKFDSFNSKSEIESFIGAFVFVIAEDAVKLPTGKYFIHDLIGLSVRNSENADYGFIKDVLILPASNIYVVEYKGKEVLIPAVDEIIKNIDIETGTIIINPIEGLFEV